jgi:hypothetical protein
MPNKWVKFVRTAHPTRNGKAPLLAAYPRRYTAEQGNQLTCPCTSYQA